ncbi:MAG: hypothetical protein KFKLKKLM_00448 [Flavobacteriales bacterium]|nr:hypothetical protein [Flavobacteriales bacterium]
MVPPFAAVVFTKLAVAGNKLLAVKLLPSNSGNPPLMVMVKVPAAQFSVGKLLVTSGRYCTAMGVPILKQVMLVLV